MVKKDGMILEGNYLNIFRKSPLLLVFKRTFKVLQPLMYHILLEKNSVFRRNAPIDSERIIQDRDTTISLRVIEVINASHALLHNCSSSRYFKVKGISLAEPIQNRKKSKKIFCCFNIKLYFCTHETSHTHHIILHSGYHPPSDSLTM